MNPIGRSTPSQLQKHVVTHLTSVRGSRSEFRPIGSDLAAFAIKTGPKRY